jgi:hypothetical protein
VAEPSLKSVRLHVVAGVYEAVAIPSTTGVIRAQPPHQDGSAIRGFEAQAGVGLRGASYAAELSPAEVLGERLCELAHTRTQRWHGSRSRR